MRKVSVFHFVTLNGFYKGVGGDISWHRHGGEESKYSGEGLASGNILLFGRVTYEMMASFWPAPAAIANMPVVAEGMNAAEKIVFSRTLKKAEWDHTRLIKDDMIGEIRKMKQTPGRDMTVLGSGSIAMQLAEAGLIDEGLALFSREKTGKPSYAAYTRQRYMIYFFNQIPSENHILGA